MARPTNTFHTDEDVNGRAIRLARELSVLIMTTPEAGLRGTTDEVHFTQAGLTQNYAGL